MAVYDTSVLIDLVDPSASHHAQAVEAMATGTIVVSLGVLDEYVRYFRTRPPRGSREEAGRRAIQTLRERPGFRSPQPVLDSDVLDIYERYPGLSIIDAWGIAIALHQDEPLVTFDADQEAAYRKEKARRSRKS